MKRTIAQVEHDAAALLRQVLLTGSNEPTDLIMKADMIARAIAEGMAGMVPVDDQDSPMIKLASMINHEVENIVE